MKEGPHREMEFPGQAHNGRIGVLRAYWDKTNQVRVCFLHTLSISILS